ncbi:lysM and putative peptidoglycan-binding domain-containing protein 4 [Anopheles bellator]|uniref:lysM and putative peptidoglycan-binding domain-containing protein 4 n=1 Tax=Anopheles bellator TaxID=139047 RepID=UPI002648B523|nr:lysM and putative peptidoglycan-binding domain-containing protein 4 [Anopheles bellator]
MKRLRVKTVGNNSNVCVEDQNPSKFDVALVENKADSVERWLEAQILPSDTLQAIALRFNCSIAVLKKLNKIDKDNEIYARNVIRIPVTPHSILLETLPRVHTSGNSSPRNATSNPEQYHNSTSCDITLDEKLIVAAVSSASYETNITGQSAKSSEEIRESIGRVDECYLDDSQPLLIDDENLPQPRALRLPANDFSCNGSDCDISWICLLVFILALCFAIPLIYVVYIAEHREKFHHGNFRDNHSIQI